MIFKIIKKNKEDGVSILEALVAVIVFILGFLGIYMMTTLSNKAMISSIERDKLNMVSAMIIESMTIDTANIEKYDETDCYAPISKSGLQDKNIKKWEKKYKKVIQSKDKDGKVNTAKKLLEDCKVEVKLVPDKTDQYMITTIITRKDGKKIHISKRINK